jgi:hypothetical protein
MKQPADNDRHDSDAAADALARLLDGWLRAQPLRPAPETLQARVMAAIERRDRRRGQQGFQRWSLSGRVAFIALASVTAKLVVELLLWLLGSVGPLHMPRMPLASTLLEAGLAIANHVPSLWLYGAIALLAAVYGGLFGIGTAVYRTLYLQR